MVGRITVGMLAKAESSKYVEDALERTKEMKEKMKREFMENVKKADRIRARAAFLDIASLRSKLESRKDNSLLSAARKIKIQD